MANDRDKQLNHDRPGGDAFSLEDILAEFGGKPAEEKRPKSAPQPEVPDKPEGKIVAFPGGAAHSAPTPEPPREEVPPPAPQPPRREEKVVEFPGEEEGGNPIAAGIGRLIRKADDYAGRMFEDEDAENDEDIRRAERYIPGTDEEQTEPEERPWRERRPRRQPPPAPDLAPGELARRYQKGLKGLRIRSGLAGLMFLPALYLTLCPVLDLPLPAVLTAPQMQIYLLAGLLLAAMLLCIDVLARGLFRLFRLNFGMDTLLVFSCGATLADACTMLLLNPREGEMPYCAAVILAVWLMARGMYLKQRGQRLACRTAAAASEPYLVTLDEGKWNARSTYTKWLGSTAGFGRQMQAEDGAQRIFRAVCPVLFVACIVLSGLASVGRGRPENLLWCLSATLAAATTLSGGLCFGIPWHSLSLRLSRSGAALAGWDAITGNARSSGILVTDTDLFPPGSVTLNGIKVFGDFSVERVVAYTATLIRQSGGGLDRIFHDLLRTQGAVYRRADRFTCHEGGGLSAEIRGEQVLVGASSFMHLMEIPLPQGMNIKNAVFCAIDGELAGIFALRYTLHGSVEPALNALIQNRVTPVMATRDFNLIPAMLRQRFKLPVEKMEYPPVERRAELSGEEQEHSDILTAVLCREGIGPYSEAVVGGRRLRRAVRTASVLTCMGAAVGVLLAFYLTFMGAYASLSAPALLIFLLLWLVPTLLISGWVNRY